MFNNSISLVGKRNKICPLERQGRCKVPFAACGGAKREVERGHPAPRKGTAVPLTPVCLLRRIRIIIHPCGRYIIT